MLSGTLVAPAPEGIVAGVNVQVAPVGKPFKLRLIAAGKVAFDGLSVKLKSAVPPGTIVTGLPPLPEMFKLKSCALWLTAALVTLTKLASPA